MLDAQNTMPIKDHASSSIKSPPKSKQDTSESTAGQKNATLPKQQQQQRPSIDVKDVLLKGAIVSSADGDELMLEVTCGQNQAALYMSRLQLGSKGTCVLFENAWLTPNEFQYISGRETAKDWKRSIKHHGKSLKVLIAKGILTTAPLKCNCGQCSTQMKDVVKYGGITAADVAGKMPLRDVVPYHLTELTSSTLKDDPTRRGFKLPSEMTDRKTTETSLLQQEAGMMNSALLNGPQLLVNGHSLDGARFSANNNNNNDHEALEKNNAAFLASFPAEHASKSERKEKAKEGELTTHVSAGGGRDRDGHSAGKRLETEGHKRSLDGSEAKVKAKKTSKTDGNDMSGSGNFRDRFASNELGKSSSSSVAETVNNRSSDAMETNSSGGIAAPKKSGSSCSSSMDKSHGTDATPWSRGTVGTMQDQTSSSYRSESTNRPNDKTTKKVPTGPNSASSSSSSAASSSFSCASSDRLGQSATSVSGKHSTMQQNRGVDAAAVRTLQSAAAEPSYLFPSFASPYYPMIAAPQLPAYYPSPYMWPVSFPQAQSCSYGWTPPTDLTGPSCLRSPLQYKESVGDGSASSSLAHGTSAVADGTVFNFPWMKQRPDASGCGNGSGESSSQLLHHDGLLLPGGKRKLQDDSVDCYPPSKHLCSFLPDAAASRQVFGADPMNWAAAGYGPAAAAFDLRGLVAPYSHLSSYIPDAARAAAASSQNVFVNSFLKASEMSGGGHHAGLNLFPNLFSSHCLGVPSR